jgi:hypothetical protein
MGARINFVFDDGTESLTVLYSHYGEYTWQDDLAGAIDHAKARHRDYSYFTRMIISHLIQDAVLAPTGFGIYSIARSEITEMWDKVVVIDLVHDLVTDLDKNTSIPFYSEVMA